jgi:predicted tellurium resistance membrane protein TerC
VFESPLFGSLGDPGFWVAVLQIIAIDIMLGGDNAVVIALATRRLPKRQRNQGIFWGVFGAVVLRIVLIFFALQLLAPPIEGGGACCLIGVKPCSRWWAMAAYIEGAPICSNHQHHRGRRGVTSTT